MPRPWIMAAVVSKPRRQQLATLNFTGNSGLTGVTHTNTTIVAPDGQSTNISLLTEDTTTGTHRMSRQAADPFNLIVPATYYNASVYVKPNGRNWVMFSIGDLQFLHSCHFDITNKIIGTPSASVFGPFFPKIEDAGINDWVRVSMAFYWSQLDATRQHNFRVSLAPADNVSSYAGDGASGLYVWGYTLHKGIYPPTFINNQWIRNAGVIPIWFAPGNT